MSYDAPTTPPPGDPDRNRTPWLVALAAVVVTIVIAVAVAFMGGSGDTGKITISAGGSATTSPDGDRPITGEVDVDGDALPPYLDGESDDAVGVTIPTITGTDYEGRPVTIEPGTPLLIVVMAHWCPHCQAEIPRIVGWNDDGRVPEELDVIGVSTAVDETRGNYPPSAWLERENWPFPVLADDDRTTALQALGSSSFPTLIAVGADGRVALRASGEGDEDRFDELVAAALEGAPGDAEVPDTTTGGTPAGSAACPAADGSSAKQQEFDGPPPMCIDSAATYTAAVDTTMGSFTITFDPTIAPVTVNNFVFLARYHYFDGIIFHRIIDGFVIQGGDPEGTGMGGPGYEFEDELPRQGSYEKYSVAMANAGPDTNGSQFFVITGPDGEALPPSYSLFGKVTAGTEVIDAISAVPTDVQDAPTTAVVINSVVITEGS
jgi:cyclophilin family peptidyl-prolyl cis-trans isomerase